MVDISKVGPAPASPDKKTPDEPITLADKIKAEEEELAKRKKKSMDAWADTGEKKSFGLWGMLKFTLPRVWTGGCLHKINTLFNVLMIFVNKGVNVLIPLVLREVIDTIICEEDKLEETDSFLVRSADAGCPSETETYMIIGLYALVKFTADFINYIREIPYANMAAVAEISIAHDVYDHVQRQCLAFHLGRETGKIIRIVSRGSQSFASVLRMLWFSLIPIFTEIILVLIIFGSLFSWEFLVL
jgi:ABC-type multidrug transport system fused ATPase/permease subunit